MQPLLASHLLLLVPLEISYLIWAVMEVILQIRQRNRFRAGAQRQDKGSHAFLICLTVLGSLLCVLLAFTVPAAAITSVREICFWLGPLVLMGCALPGFSYRIRVEEQVLQEHLGLPYQEYMRRTKRLIPFVL